MVVKEKYKKIGFTVEKHEQPCLQRVFFRNWKRVASSSHKFLLSKFYILCVHGDMN